MVIGGEWWIVGNLAQHEEPTLWQLGPKQHLFKHFLSEEEQNMTRTASQGVFVDCYSNKLFSGLHMRDSLSVPPSYEGGTEGFREEES